MQVQMDTENWLYYKNHLNLSALGEVQLMIYMYFDVYLHTLQETRSTLKTHYYGCLKYYYQYLGTASQSAWLSDEQKMMFALFMGKE